MLHSRIRLGSAEPTERSSFRDCSWATFFDCSFYIPPRWLQRGTIVTEGNELERKIAANNRCTRSYLYRRSWRLVVHGKLGRAPDRARFPRNSCH